MKTLLSLDDATEKKYFIFKHSSTCPVSASARRQVEKAELLLDVPVYLMVVQEGRDVSAEIARKFGIRHESPQLILVRDGNAVWERAHYTILSKDIRTAAEK